MTTGELQTSEASIYVVPSDKTATISSVNVFNRSGSTRTGFLSVKEANESVSRTQGRFVLLDNERWLDETVLFMKPNDELLAYADGGGVDWKLNVTEKELV